ncbi:MAG: hypothetical protein JO329_22570, partial [Planctomycetaceae bacterium]|nr:hypothetical protein [Planctomycetaceae bacterium]
TPSVTGRPSIVARTSKVPTFSTVTVFRSVPPTSLPFANLKPGQTRHLPTRLVSLAPPDPEDPVALPAKGEKLTLGDIGELTDDARVQTALKRLSADKAPPTVAQLVLWRVTSGLEWDQIAELSKGWANESERALARDFVDRLGNPADGESASLFCQVVVADSALQGLADEIGKVLTERKTVTVEKVGTFDVRATMLGLPVTLSVPAQPRGPAVACKIQLTGTAERPEALVQVATSGASATSWQPAGKFTLPLSREAGPMKAAEVADTLAEGLLGRLVRAQLSKTATKVKGQDVYKVRIDNASPLVLNGVAVLGSEAKTGELPKVLSGISISPGKSMTVPATSEMVEQLGLRKGLRVIAADLGGL